jgi:biopolymer transport protein ExbD
MDDELEEPREGMYGINVTPLVDVSLVLVLIFMVTSPFFAKPLIPVKLPEAVASESEDRQNITVSISPEEGYAINEIPAKKEALPVLLEQQLKESGFSFVLIRADERVPHGEVQDVMKAAKRAGARRIAFATTPKI